VHAQDLEQMGVTMRLDEPAIAGAAVNDVLDMYKLELMARCLFTVEGKLRNRGMPRGFFCHQDLDPPGVIPATMTQKYNFLHENSLAPAALTVHAGSTFPGSTP
jgi:hypothetical protein